MKILEICNFSAGISGVWTRAFEESKRLAKEHDVWVFSSNLENNRPTAKKSEEIEGVKIRRFPTKGKIGYAVMFDFEKEALKLRPDVIIAHGFRKPYLNQIIRASKKLGIRCYLVTHAPFVEKNLRKWWLNLIIRAYNKIYSKKILNSFTKIIAITDWEVPFLLKLGAKKEKIIVIPNGILREFFKSKKTKIEKKNILFIGRIDPIKDLETLISAIALLKDKKATLELVGPGDSKYIKGLKALAKQKNVEKRIKFVGPIYDLTKKINKIDSTAVFVLPSKREAMPQSLIEAKARGKVVISSDNIGGKELVKDGKDGYIFRRGSARELAEKLDCALEKDTRKMRKNARASVERFSWDKVIKQIEKTIGNPYNNL